MENERRQRSLGPSESPFSLDMLPCRVEVLSFSAKDHDVGSVRSFLADKRKAS